MNKKDTDMFNNAMRAGVIDGRGGNTVVTGILIPQLLFKERTKATRMVKRLKHTQ